MNPGSRVARRHVGQRIALAAAVFCGLLALPVFALFVWLWRERGLADNWTPSALAGVAFLGCCAGVLYVMSRPANVLGDSAPPSA
ncbi:MAG: hypothetical protein FIB06_05165 [Betaproteobacteria bacterium]|nr:hypothetical protein [Betaproteobacteria bacterium]